MNIRSVFRAVAAVLLVIGIAMGTSVPVSWAMGDQPKVYLHLLTLSLLTILVAVGGLVLVRHNKNPVYVREGFAIVTFSWIVASAFGAIPYVWLGGFSFSDAFFETMSGFTTTGASIMNTIEDQAYGLLYWRALTQWLGGMGIVVLSLAVLPLLGTAGGIRMYYAEVPGATSDRLAPRIAHASKLLWGVYLLITVGLVICLLFGGMSLFDAVCHAFCAMSTGGFSTRQASIAVFNSAYIDGVFTLFMFLAGTNFMLHLRALTGRPLDFWRDEEFITYLGICLGAIVLVSSNLLLAGTYHHLGEAVRYSSFTVLSMITTTGFCTANFDTWPMFSRMLLLTLMCVGGCGGSTAGGIKVSRLLLLFKYAVAELRRCCYPHSISNIHFNRQRLQDAVMTRILGFAVLFFSLLLLFALLVAIIEPNLQANPATTSSGQTYSAFETALSSAVATLCNIGPGLSRVGAVQNYAWMSAPTKWLLAFAMLVGRLEVFTVMVLFLPRFWRK